MTIVATLLPVAGPAMDDETVDAVIGRAIRAGLIACNAMRGPFRIAFFPPGRIPAGWSRIGMCLRLRSGSETA